MKNASGGCCSLDVVRVPQWERIDWLLHGFSTRRGGISTVYGAQPSLNLGWTPEDTADAVRQNRRMFAREIRTGAGVSTAIADRPDRFDAGASLVGLRQSHSAQLQCVRPEDGASEGRLESADGRPILCGDGLISHVPGAVLAVSVADCVPVLVADRSQRVVAAFHAGWRGTASRIVELGIAVMRSHYGTQPEDLTAAIGPSIGPCCYEVGQDLRTIFLSHVNADDLFAESQTSPPSGECSRTRLTLDLWNANRRQLLNAGVPAGDIHVVEECTACTRVGGQLKYFSHRAQAGVTGRMLGAIGIAD